MNTDLSSQIKAEIDGLQPDAQRCVLDYVQSLKRPGGGTSVDTIRKHFGTISSDDAESMRKVIDDGCEQVNLDEW